MENTLGARFVRHVGAGHYEVWIGGYIVGRVVARFGGDYRARGEVDLYGEWGDLGFADTLLGAAHIVAGNHAEIEAWREAEARSEFIAEYGMSYVCGGGSASDATLMAHMAWEAGNR